MRGQERSNVLRPAGPRDFPATSPSRTLKKANRNVTGGAEWYPMLGLAAAPEMANAVPSVMALRSCPLMPYSLERRYPRFQLPQNSGDAVNDWAFRCCQARFSALTRLMAMLRIWKGLRIA